MNLHFDPTEFAPLIDQAVDAAIRKHMDARPRDEAGQLLCDKRQAAERLSLSVSSLDRLVAAGEIKAVRLAGRVLFSDDALRDWIARKEAE